MHINKHQRCIFKVIRSVHVSYTEILTKTVRGGCAVVFRCRIHVGFESSWIHMDILMII